MKPASALCRAWNDGYIVGLEGRADPCPYVDGPLHDEWWAGYFAGENRAIAHGLRTREVTA